MKQIVLFDNERWTKMLPLTFTRPIAEVRCGIFTITEKWERHCANLGIKPKISFATTGYLSHKYKLASAGEQLWINAALLPDFAFYEQILNCKPGYGFRQGEEVIAVAGNGSELHQWYQGGELEGIIWTELSEITLLGRPFDVFRLNDREIRADFEILCSNRDTQNISDNNRIIGNGPLFIEASARVEGATINTNDGPVYIGHEAEVMEGAMIRGPFALGYHSTIKMGAKIYGATTIGPHCKVGGEVSNSVIFGFSNKAHDGFLGNSVLGEWCNLGADTNNSNLKNNYEDVKLWDYETKRFERTGLQFCGLIMGDHSKSGINTMFNTGTVVGLSANIFGAGFPRTFIPSFSWGGAQGFDTYQLDKALQTARLVMKRRDIQLSAEEIAIFTHVFENYREFRVWEKNSNN